MENARRLDLRLVVGALAIACVAMAIWAATALAGGSSPATNEPATSPAAAFIQESPEEEESRPPQPGDCPERDGEGDGDSGSSDTSSSDL